MPRIKVGFALEQKEYGMEPAAAAVHWFALSGLKICRQYESRSIVKQIDTDPLYEGPCSWRRDTIIGKCGTRTKSGGEMFCLKYAQR